MHNKSFTADNQVDDHRRTQHRRRIFRRRRRRRASSTWMCRRSARSSRDVSNDFDRYWASRVGVSGRAAAPTAGFRTLEARSSGPPHRARAGATALLRALRTSPSSRDSSMARCRSSGRTTRMVSDDPAKGLGLARGRTTVPEQLIEIIGSPVQRARARLAVLRAGPMRASIPSCALRAGACAFASSSTRSRPRT